MMTNICVDNKEILAELLQAGGLAFNCNGECHKNNKVIVLDKVHRHHHLHIQYSFSFLNIAPIDAQAIIIVAAVIIIATILTHRFFRNTSICCF